MAIIKRGILGGFSKKIGNVVGGSWKGIDYMRVLPNSVANPNTAAQQTQRNSFSGAVAFAKGILSGIIKPLMDRFAQQQSGYNLFISSNISLFDSPGVINTPADLIIAQGSLLGFAGFSAVEGATPDEIAVTWPDNSGTGNAVATDEVYLVAFNADTGEIVVGSDIADRDTTAFTLNFVEGQASGNVVHVWGALRREDGTLVSNTSYSSYNIA